MKKGLLRKISLIALITALIITVLSCFLFWKEYLWYDTRDFKGQAEISDLGPWTYPRYLIRFDEIDLGISAQHKMVVQGLPPIEMTFRFSMRADCQEEMVRSCKSNINLSFTDDKGRTISSVSAPVNEWVFSKSVSETELWHPECRDVRLSPNKTYTLRIEIQANKNAKSFPARPFLSGGGLELP